MSHINIRTDVIGTDVITINDVMATLEEKYELFYMLKKKGLFFNQNRSFEKMLHLLNRLMLLMR